MKKTDFKSLIRDLLKRGMTEASIAAEVGQTRQNIHNILVRDTHIPNWEVGHALIAMHRKTMKKYPKIDDVA